MADPEPEPAARGQSRADPEPEPAARDESRATDELLGRLQGHLRRASEAAEGLRSQPSARKPGPGRRPPPRGWAEPAGGGAGGSDGSLRDEIELALGLLGSLRDRIPPELQQRLAEAVREVLLALRAVIDWYLARTEPTEGPDAAGADARADARAGPEARPGEVRDIPIL